MERYKRLREIGRGGMGAVYLGEDTVLGRQVAVKQVGLVPGSDVADEQRVLREARTLAALHHPNIVAVYDLVEEGTSHWLVMEYVESRNLSELVRANGPMSPDELAPILSQVADALQTAHAAGFIHRDVKPGNILVTPQGIAKIADFGIARGTYDASLTQTGLMTGSPAYLAPEVAQGRPAGPAGDVWGLGTTAYFALTGENPYAGADPVSTMFRVVNDEPPRTSKAGWMAPLLAGLCEKDPDLRWSLGAAREFLVSGDTWGSSAATSVLPVGTQPTATTREQPEPIDPIDPDPRPAPPPSAGASRGRSKTPLLVAAGVVLLIALIGLLASQILGDDTNQSAGGSPTGSESSSSSGSPTESQSPTESPSESATTKEKKKDKDKAPSEAEMSDFVAGYVATAAENPDASFSQLTPKFQQESGGISGYKGFWDSIDSATVSNVVADPEAMTVSYDVTYTQDGKTSPGSTTLRLVERGGSLFIDGEG